MKQIVLLEYTFMFEPGDTWAHLYEFEKTLSDFFATKGLDAQIIKAIEGGGTKRVLYLRKKETPMPTMGTSGGRPKSLKGIIKNMTSKTVMANERDFKKGKLLKTKGYLRK